MALQSQWAYAFQDVVANITGPNGSFSLNNNGVADEGITITPDERISKQTGAAGDWMYTLRANKGGRVSIRVLKNGVLNGLLSRMFNMDTLSSANVGKNTISISVPVVGDSWTLIGVAFARIPAVTYAAEGPVVEWDGMAGIISGVIGLGAPTLF